MFVALERRRTEHYSYFALQRAGLFGAKGEEARVCLRRRLLALNAECRVYRFSRVCLQLCVCRFALTEGTSRFSAFRRRVFRLAKLKCETAWRHITFPFNRENNASKCTGDLCRGISRLVIKVELKMGAKYTSNVTIYTSNVTIRVQNERSTRLSVGLKQLSQFTAALVNSQLVQAWLCVLVLLVA